MNNGILITIYFITWIALFVSLGISIVLTGTLIDKKGKSFQTWVLGILIFILLLWGFNNIFISPVDLEKHVSNIVHLDVLPIIIGSIFGFFETPIIESIEDDNIGLSLGIIFFLNMFLIGGCSIIWLPSYAPFVISFILSSLITRLIYKVFFNDK